MHKYTDRPFCKHCGIRFVVYKGTSKTTGKLWWGNSCRECQLKPYLRYRGERCEICDFVPGIASQLDVHHRNHNHKDNDPTNLQTLCANCHRLVTYNYIKEKDSLSPNTEQEQS